MSMFKNKVKEMLREGRTTIGSWVWTGHPDVAEVMANMGFDWLVFDTEHGPIDIGEVQLMLQATSYTPIVPIVRVAWNDPVLIKRALDVGAQGIVVPWVNTKEQAEMAVKACRYPPRGVRGVGPRRASRYGLEVMEYIREADDQILVVLQIETAEAVENVEAILSVEGIDALFIGPFDLSASMGLVGQINHPRVVEAILKVEKACKGTTTAPGIFTGNAEAAKKALSQGFRFISVGSDTDFIINSAKTTLEEIRSAASG